MNTTIRNPYVGSRTFQREDRDLFFGRDREARDLTALVSSERLILFYAQSGAGKSSLLNTRLIPDLENSNFEVLPVGRVKGDFPAGLEVDNIYVHNLLSSIVQQKVDPKSLTKISLSQFLAVLEFNEIGYMYDEDTEAGIKEELRWRRVLIIDQFEEIFTTHPEAWEKREGFFRQLAQAMGDDPYLTVFLLMRDDYIASLDLYAHLLPGGLRTRYYMQRLTRGAALQAIKKPVENRRPFGEEVAEKLVEDLASTQVQKSDGGQEVQPVQHVEPVQLQVVCYGLWESLSPDGKEITEEDLLEVGDVNQSLERYYDRRVAAVAKQKNVPEQLIREWFDRELITSSGTRNMVLQDLNKDTGVSDDVIQALRGGLVHADLRAGQIWYELSHDRLIEPVRRSNAEWFEGHLSLFQRRVMLWTQQERSESLLLRGKELVDAEGEAAGLTLTAEEGEFLEDCRSLSIRIQRDRHQRRIIMASLIGSVILLVAAVFFGIYAVSARNDAEEKRVEANIAKAEAEAAKAEADEARIEAEDQRAVAEQEKARAEEQATIALAGSLAAQAESLKNSDHALALLLGVEAYNRKGGLLTEKTLFQLLQFSPYKSYPEFDGAVSSVAVSPDGRRIAITSCRYDEDQECKLGDITLFDENLENPREIPGDYGIVYSMAFHEYDDQLRLAAGGCVPGGCSENKGQLTLWEITAEEPVELKQVEGHTALVKTLAFSPDGRLLASGSYDTTILLWDLSEPANPEKIGDPLEHASFVNGVSFSPDGKYLASAGDDKTINLWDVSNIGNIPPAYTFRRHNGPVASVASGPGDLKPACEDGDGYVFATSGDDSMVYVWDWCPASNPPWKNHIPFPEGHIGALDGHTGYVKSVAFNADGTVLASAGFDNTVILWDTNTGAQIGPPLSLHTKAVNQVAFGSITRDGNHQPYLISVSNDRTALQWELYTRNPICRFLDMDHSECQDIDKGEWPQKACQAAKRNLTLEEWKDYLLNDSREKTCEDYPLQDP